MQWSISLGLSCIAFWLHCGLWPFLCICILQGLSYSLHLPLLVLSLCIEVLKMTSLFRVVALTCFKTGHWLEGSGYAGHQLEGTVMAIWLKLRESKFSLLWQASIILCQICSKVMLLLKVLSKFLQLATLLSCGTVWLSEGADPNSWGLLPFGSWDSASHYWALKDLAGQVRFTAFPRQVLTEAYFLFCPNCP